MRGAPRFERVRVSGLRVGRSVPCQDAAPPRIRHARVVGSDPPPQAKAPAAAHLRLLHAGRLIRHHRATAEAAVRSSDRRNHASLGSGNRGPPCMAGNADALPWHQSSSPNARCADLAARSSWPHHPGRIRMHPHCAVDQRQSASMASWFIGVTDERWASIPGVDQGEETGPHDCGPDGSNGGAVDPRRRLSRNNRGRAHAATVRTVGVWIVLAPRRTPSGPRVDPIPGADAVPRDPVCAPRS